jgi:hypothetical protein
MFIHRVRALLSAVVVLVGFGFATAVPASAARHPSHHSARHHHTTVHTGIPQHNGGDQDADNNGGPSDGDGNI